MINFSTYQVSQWDQTTKCRKCDEGLLLYNYLFAYITKILKGSESCCILFYKEGGMTINQNKIMSLNIQSVK